VCAPSPSSSTDTERPVAWRGREHGDDVLLSVGFEQLDGHPVGGELECDRPRVAGPFSLQRRHEQALRISVGCPPAIFTLHHRAPERHAPDHSLVAGPGQGLSVHDGAFEVCSGPLGIRGGVDPAATGLFGGAVVSKTSSSPGPKEPEWPMSTVREELLTRQPESRIDETREPCRPLVGDDEPGPPTRHGREIVGWPTQPQPLRARKDPRPAGSAARSVPLEARGPRVAQPYTCASVRRPPLPTLPDALP
jgi:hypothetical protein